MQERVHLCTAIVQVMKQELRLNHAMGFAVLFGEDSDSSEDIEVRVAKVIDDNDVESFLQKLERGVGSDVAKATDDHDVVSRYGIEVWP